MSKLDCSYFNAMNPRVSHFIENPYNCSGESLLYQCIDTIYSYVNAMNPRVSHFIGNPYN